MQQIQNEIQVQLANEKATELISIAEAMFGSVNSQWKYGGVIFDDNPPHLHYWPDTTTLQISLSLKAINDELQRDFQLAHEVCHLLYPSVKPERPETPQTNLINEGISTYFSIYIVERFYGKDTAQAIAENLNSHSPKYFQAFQQVFNLMKQDKESIKKIRKIQPMINEVNKHDLIESGLELTQEAIDALVAAF
jgi:hypothetical protein